MSEDRSFDLSTALFHVTMYARKVGTSANSALIRYYLPRLKLSIALLSRKRGNERLVPEKGSLKHKWKDACQQDKKSTGLRDGRSDME